MPDRSAAAPSPLFAAVRAGDVDAFLPVHTHATALHQAVDHDDAALVELLLSRGARTDLRDTLWDGTPLDWAIHQRRPAARGTRAAR